MFRLAVLVSCRIHWDPKSQLVLYIFTYFLQIFSSSVLLCGLCRCWGWGRGWSLLRLWLLWTLRWIRSEQLRRLRTWIQPWLLHSWILWSWLQPWLLRTWIRLRPWLRILWLDSRSPKKSAIAGVLQTPELAGVSALSYLTAGYHIWQQKNQNWNKYPN